MTAYENLKRKHRAVFDDEPSVEVIADFDTPRAGVKEIVGSARLEMYDEYSGGHASALYKADDAFFNVRYLGDRAHIIKYRILDTREQMRRDPDRAERAMLSALRIWASDIFGQAARFAATRIVERRALKNALGNAHIIKVDSSEGCILSYYHNSEAQIGYIVAETDFCEGVAGLIEVPTVPSM